MNEQIGPIHQWLYNKINMQEFINAKIFQLAKKMKWENGLKEKTDAEIGEVPSGKLEEIIDQENVHMWLQKKVDLVETRFAFAVMTLLKEDAARLEHIVKNMYKSGTEIGLENSENAVEVAAQIDGILLNGMPCDRVTNMIKKNENYVETETTKMIHEIYWVQQGGSNEIYEKLVEAFIQGMISKEGYVYSRCGSVNKIYKKNLSK